MDNFSLLQIIERVPELRFKYMGSYPSDTVHQKTKFSFAIFNSAMIEENNGLWLLVWIKATTLLILWEKRDQRTPF